MSRLRFYVLSIGVLLLTSINIGAAPETVRLSNAVWTVDINPQLLAVEAYPADSAVSVPISSGQTGFGNIKDFSEKANTASWRLPERFLTVRFELIDDSLSVEFIQDKLANDVLGLTWPVIEDFESLHGYIFPFFEGSYVPKDDVKWQNFLSDRGAINTTAGLSMPFWGLDLGERTLTYILTNPFNNQILFNNTTTSGFGMQVSHTFTPNWEEKRYGLRISLGTASPVAPAKQYRHWLKQNAEFISFAEKIEKTPAAEKLLGAAHVYLWGGKLLSEYDVTDWKTFATRLSGDSSVAKQIWAQLNAEMREAIREVVQSDYPSKYSLRVVSRAISGQLEKHNFYEPSVWTAVPLTPEVKALISHDVSTLSSPELYRRNCLLLYAAFSDVLRHPDEWGDGLSVKLLEQFAENGLDKLWLGADSWQDGFRHPTAVAKAKELGYLVGPYDSYHSIHHPNEKDTWETAQFDLTLYETGAIVNADGTKSRGFKKKGYHLSPLAAKPYVENRVNGIVEQMPSDFNTWFIDCDAYGELYDDYSTSHPATQLDDMRARLDRISWIRDTHDMVVGSEGGAAYSAAVLHFAHGMTVPVIGWGDPDMKSKTSPYYVGGYWPPEGPAVHIKQVPLKPNYLYHYYDPRFRLPLYQIVFHDSVITTHHWGSGSLKFENAIATLALLELLYNVPPLYHLNMAEFSKHKAWIKRYYAFFSPLHRQVGGRAMTDFEWLSDDRQIQRTEFGDAVEIFANFGTEPFEYEGLVIPRRSAVARWRDTGKIELFSVE
ncbi:glycoside hydrolase [Candidatus Poribacteria bacterium]|nr:glycoside hydrolase [Candidatus Poribacteria bacterium]